MTILQEFVNKADRQENVNLHPLPDSIAAYDFPPAMLSRLQRDHGWTPAFTRLAVDEYRRFVHLAASAPHALTPSKAVDEVWHTHLMFTQDYWLRFMPLLPAPLHHQPGDGTPSSDAHFRDQYTRTLDLYRKTLGQVPPPEVWPAPSQEQAGASFGRRKVWPLPVAALLGAGVLLTLQSVFLAGFIFILALILLSGVAQGHGQPGREPQGDGGGGFLAAFFTGGETCDSSDSSACGDGGDSSCGSGCGGGCGS